MLKSLFICLTLTTNLEPVASAFCPALAPRTAPLQAVADPNVPVLHAYVSNTVQTLYPSLGLPAYGDNVLLEALIAGIDSLPGLTPGTGWCANGFDARITCNGIGPRAEFRASGGFALCSSLPIPAEAYAGVEALAATQLIPGRVARYIVFSNVLQSRLYTHTISLPGPFWAAERYCIAAPNSLGPGAAVYASGSIGLGTNNFTLLAGPVPSLTTGIFYLGSAEALLPFGNGYRCIGGGLLRLPPQQASGGYLSYTIALPDPLANLITTGGPWHFQAWYRDAAAGGANFNLSDGIRVIRCP